MSTTLLGYYTTPTCKRPSESSWGNVNQSCPTPPHTWFEFLRLGPRVSVLKFGPREWTIVTPESIEGATRLGIRGVVILLLLLSVTHNDVTIYSVPSKGRVLL